MRIRNIYNRVYNAFEIRKNNIKVGSGTLIGGKLFVRGRKGSISIGNDTIINSDDEAVPLGYQSRTIFWTMDAGSISIGNRCGISNATFCSASSIEIQDYVTIGGGVKIFDTDFHSLTFEKRIDYENDDDRKAKPIIIKKGSFIGAGAVILKGVTIGEKTVVGAGSVVTKSVPDGEIWAGNPARFVKKL